MLRRTKIIATVGPASRDDDVLAALVGAGVDIFRLNFAHGTADEHAAAVERIRRAEARADRPVAVLQDLAGPKIRTGRLAGGQPLVLAEGDRLRLEVGDGEGGPGRIFTAHAPLVEALKPGDRLLLDDGRIELQVAAAARGAVDTVVVHGGRLGEHRGINAPGVVLPGSALTAKDEADLRLGLELGVDFVALSFVQAAADLQRARRAVEGAGRPVALVAKIERPAAVEHLEEILDACDAVMVARGDLGIELPLERVPRIQKEITRRARAKGLPVIVATEVLESMRTAMRPTRAEVSDAANAVEDFVDAIMLAAETAIGAHPVDAVRTLDAVIRDAEAILPDPGSPGPGVDPTRTGHGRALGEAA
ncbi:MAG TPA: pyruvate kinase, partial [Vicinamibacterales bacterium]|nr:pyruvate kinase [Vicinamibacterales bacterium]